MESYDRLFPSQDTMPRGGFGNLIALPLQHGPRQEGHSVFLDENLGAYPDDQQWLALATVRRIDAATVERIASDAARAGTIVGVRIAEATDEDEHALPWTRLPSGTPRARRLAGPMPARVPSTFAQRHEQYTVLLASRSRHWGCTVSPATELAGCTGVPEPGTVQAEPMPSGGLPVWSWPYGHVVRPRKWFTRHRAPPHAALFSSRVTSFTLNPAKVAEDLGGRDALGPHGGCARRAGGGSGRSLAASEDGACTRRRPRGRGEHNGLRALARRGCRHVAPPRLRRRGTRPADPVGGRQLREDADRT